MFAYHFLSSIKINNKIHLNKYLLNLSVKMFCIVILSPRCLYACVIFVSLLRMDLTKCKTRPNLYAAVLMHCAMQHGFTQDIKYTAIIAQDHHCSHFPLISNICIISYRNQNSKRPSNYSTLKLVELLIFELTVISLQA